MSSAWIVRQQSESESGNALVTVGVTGPDAPQLGVPSGVEALGLRHHERPAPLWWLGVHGGSGEDMLAQVSGWPAAGHLWPVHLDDSPARVVLVARTSMRGLHAARRAAMQWGGGGASGAQLLGLVLSADAPGRLPAQLCQLQKIVCGMVPRVWQVPWIASWRTCAAPVPLDESPRALQRVILDLETLLKGQS